MENIDIYINNTLIVFNYKFKSYKTGLIKVKFKFKNLLISTSFIFYKCMAINSIDLSSFNTNNVTDMSSMFDECSSLKLIDLSSFNTNNVTNMSAMFFNFIQLKSIDLSSFDTTNVVNMRWMFNLCVNLEKQNIKVSEKGIKNLDEFETSLISNAFKAIFK